MNPIVETQTIVFNSIDLIIICLFIIFAIIYYNTYIYFFKMVLYTLVFYYVFGLKIETSSPLFDICFNFFVAGGFVFSCNILLNKKYLSKKFDDILKNISLVIMFLLFVLFYLNDVITFYNIKLLDKKHLIIVIVSAFISWGLISLYNKIKNM